MVGGSSGSEVGSDGYDHAADVGEVVRSNGPNEQLFDQGPDVVQRGDGREGLAGAERSACEGEQQGGGDDVDGDAAVMEGAGQLAVGPADVTRGSRHESIELENALYVEIARERSGHDQLRARGSCDLAFARGCWAYVSR